MTSSFRNGALGRTSSLRITALVVMASVIAMASAFSPSAMAQSGKDLEEFTVDRIDPSGEGSDCSEVSDNYRCACTSCACGAGCACGSPTRSALPRGVGGFDSNNVRLLSRISLPEFGPTYTQGTDSWGYVSPSGREYAIMGMNTGVAFVEVTDPVNPAIIGIVDHPRSLWSDVKTYQSFAYIVNDEDGFGGDGIQVVDLSQIDNGIITQLPSVLSNGLATAHNIAIDTDSGYAYLCGSNIATFGLAVYSLQNPAAPALVATTIDSYVHDAQIVTYTEGPLAGRQIAYCFNGGFGVDIVDVTDKGNIFRVSRTGYLGLNYSHQGWLDKENQLVYMNDELDELNGAVSQTLTRVLDVSNINSPTFVDSFTSGIFAIDHNLYFKDGFVYEANYRSGMRIFDVRGGIGNTVEAGYFDTFNGPDAAEFDGAWNAYPFLPSGNVVLSDIQGGLFMLDPAYALIGGPPLALEIVDGAPATLSPFGTTIRVRVAELNGQTLDPASVTLTVDLGAGDVVLPTTQVSADEFEATIPGGDCGTPVTFFASAETPEDVAVFEPFNAPALRFTAAIASTETLAFDDDLELDQGWSVGTDEDTATTGVWVRVDPVGTGAQPENDNTDAGTLCFVTGNAAPGQGIGANDVDNGITTLLSPVMDATGGDATLSYFRWFSNDQGSNPFEDSMLVSISDDGGFTWTLLEDVSENTGVWVQRSFLVSDFVTPTDQIVLRFVARDLNAGSIVEAGVDDVRLSFLECNGTPDLDGDGQVGSSDLAIMIGTWGPCVDCPGDLDGDGVIGSTDLATLIGSWGPLP